MNGTAGKAVGATGWAAAIAAALGAYVQHDQLEVAKFTVAKLSELQSECMNALVEDEP